MPLDALGRAVWAFSLKTLNNACNYKKCRVQEEVVVVNFARTSRRRPDRGAPPARAPATRRPAAKPSGGVFPRGIPRKHHASARHRNRAARRPEETRHPRTRRESRRSRGHARARAPRPPRRARRFRVGAVVEPRRDARGAVSPRGSAFALRGRRGARDGKAETHREESSQRAQRAPPRRRLRRRRPRHQQRQGEREYRERHAVFA